MAQRWALTRRKAFSIGFRLFSVRCKGGKNIYANRCTAKEGWRAKSLKTSCLLVALDRFVLAVFFQKQTYLTHHTARLHHLFVMKKFTISFTRMCSWIVLIALFLIPVGCIYQGYRGAKFYEDNHLYPHAPRGYLGLLYGILFYGELYLLAVYIAIRSLAARSSSYFLLNLFHILLILGLAILPVIFFIRTAFLKQ